MRPDAPSSPAIDHVVGTFPRTELSAALAATHRAGFGPQTRVFDGARGDTARQLERAGLRVLDGAPPATDALLIVVTAPGRTAIVAELFERLGAEAVLLAARGAAAGHSPWRCRGRFRVLRLGLVPFRPAQRYRG